MNRSVPRQPSNSRTSPTSSADLWNLPRLPALVGEAPGISFRSGLTASRGRLLIGTGTGTPVHAASFVRRREIVLDAALRRTPDRLARIFVHEVFHFVWVRLSNKLRRSYEDLLAHEMDNRVRGELGWSAEWRKRELRPQQITKRTRAWREYACESFCDTAAWLYSGARRYAENTLAARHRERRRRWMERSLKPPLPI